MEQLRKQLIKEPYYKRLDNYYKSLGLKELIELLKITLNNNIIGCDAVLNDPQYNKYIKENYLINDRINKLNYSQSIILLNYWIEYHNYKMNY